MATTNTVKTEDVVGVKSRVSWPAILAGAVIALAANLIITFFLMAVGLSLTEAGVRENAVSTGALIAYLVGIIVSLFIGGWVTSQLTAGETDQEAILYGILTWAVVVGFSLAVVGMGAREGYYALVRGSMVAQQAPGANWEEGARAVGISQQKIDDMKAAADPKRAAEIANDPTTKERVREAAIAASWATLVGLMLSMVACIGGSMCGRGAIFRLFPIARVETARREVVVT
ncbi:MAG: hypothetical protein L0241_23765 [Planctomycetia bacterium]|nr:hypothetical protein [Planctomycetia bacterium]